MNRLIFIVVMLFLSNVAFADVLVVRYIDGTVFSSKFKPLEEIKSPVSFLVCWKQKDLANILEIYNYSGEMAAVSEARRLSYQKPRRRPYFNPVKNNKCGEFPSGVSFKVFFRIKGFKLLNKRGDLVYLEVVEIETEMYGVVYAVLEIHDSEKDMHEIYNTKNNDTYAKH